MSVPKRGRIPKEGSKTSKNCFYVNCSNHSRNSRLSDADQSDHNYCLKNSSIKFFGFYKPCLRFRKGDPLHDTLECTVCLTAIKWLRNCGRVDSLSCITKDRYICSLHFVNNEGPTEEFPFPIPYSSEVMDVCEATITIPNTQPNPQFSEIRNICGNNVPSSFSQTEGTMKFQTLRIDRIGNESIIKISNLNLQSNNSVDKEINVNRALQISSTKREINTAEASNDVATREASLPGTSAFLPTPKRKCLRKSNEIANFLKICCEETVCVDSRNISFFEKPLLLYESNDILVPFNSSLNIRASKQENHFVTAKGKRFQVKCSATQTKNVKTKSIKISCCPATSEKFTQTKLDLV